MPKKEETKTEDIFKWKCPRCKKKKLIRPEVRDICFTCSLEIQNAETEALAESMLNSTLIDVRVSNARTKTIRHITLQSDNFIFRIEGLEGQPLIISKQEERNGD